LGFDPIAKYGGVGASVDLTNGYIVVMQHPVTTEYQLARTHVNETLHAVRDANVPALWFWPNVDAGSDATSSGIRAFREKYAPTNVHFFKNMEPDDFLRLLVNSRGLVGNSSVGIRESSFLGVPVVNIGSRQQGRERGANVLDVDYDRAAIKHALEAQWARGRYEKDLTYGDGYAGTRIAKLLATVPLKIEKRLMY
ncbi:MAG TPA: UDP-N-acetylglucosamine 2-epimerase, partial [Kofleriaceae bacterium]